MAKNTNNIGFRLADIVTEQFATFDISADCENNIQLTTDIETGFNAEDKVIGIMAKFTFKANSEPFIVVEGGCYFEIEPQKWDSMIIENTITFPKEFIRHLAVITVGTTRGILHAKTENTEFNQYHLPTVNVTEIITEDSIVRL